MLNHTYTSVKNANLVDCGKKIHISSQPSPLLKENFLGEFRTDLDKKKVLANLGVVTDLLLEWEFIKGDIGKNAALMGELESRTKYVSKIDGFTKTLTDGIHYLEEIVGGEQDAETAQDKRLESLEAQTKDLLETLTQIKTDLEESVKIDVEKLKTDLETVTKKVENITELIKVSTKEGNALILLSSDDVAEGEIPGLYVPDLSSKVSNSEQAIEELQTNVSTVQKSLENFVTKEELGGDSFDFVEQTEFDSFVSNTNQSINSINTELTKTVKTGEDGHVDTLYVNTISKNNDDGNIKITDSFEVESGIPLDVRFVVKSLNDLHTLDPKVCYPGMGVIVSEKASLFILREPISGVIDEAYIQDEKGENWKCPEDLVIEVVTQEQYDNYVETGNISPNLFYYIQENEDLDKEPDPNDYTGGVESEEYKEALNRWLRHLQGQYMSAVWGREIEDLVANKASQESIKSLEIKITNLQQLINSLSGNTEGLNLKDLNERITLNTNNLNTLISEGGTIPTISQTLNDLQNDVSNNYVTIDSITQEDPNSEYIFVKKSVFNEYVESHNKSIAEKITTGELNVSQGIIIGDNTLNSSESDLLLNAEKIALNKNVPVIIPITTQAFEDLETKDSNTYYYVYDQEERYVLDSELTEYKDFQTKALQGLNSSITNQQSQIGTLNLLETDNKNSLVYAVNELVSKINNLTSELTLLKEQLNKESNT